MTPPQTSTCPNCGAAAVGRFCSSCGTALAGATCAGCGTALTPGARFCHRCGTPAGSTPAANRGFASGLPWAVAAIALVALIALVVGQRFGGRNTPAQTASSDSAAPPAGVMPRAPDISQMTPVQRAERLFDRIMAESEQGNIENVKTFMPMAIAAYEMLAPLNLDQRYDLGRIGIAGGDTTLARAQADTILASKPTHLLGLILAAGAARLKGQPTRAREFDQKFLAAEPKERTSGLGEYLLHKNDIDAALAAARASTK